MTSLTLKGNFAEQHAPRKIWGSLFRLAKKSGELLGSSTQLPWAPCSMPVSLFRQRKSTRCFLAPEDQGLGTHLTGGRPCLEKKLKMRSGRQSTSTNNTTRTSNISCLVTCFQQRNSQVRGGLDQNPKKGLTFAYIREPLGLRPFARRGSRPRPLTTGAVKWPIRVS